MSEQKQGERFIVLEAAAGRGAFWCDLSESFGTELEAVAAAQQSTIPGGEKLVVLGFRFCATINPPPPKIHGLERGSPILPATDRYFPASENLVALTEFADAVNRGAISDGRP